MVRPVTSKRKLFNNNKDQFKENEPDQIITSDSETFVNSKTHSLASSLFTNKSLNSSKTSPAESSSKNERRRESLSCGDWQRRCEAEDGGTTFTTGRTAMPMSERQQIALLMQLSSPSPPTNKSDRNSLNSPQTPTTPHFGRGIAKRNERGETPLHVAAIKGDCEKVAQLISQGASVNATDYAGWTALHEACNRGFLVIASLLIKGGADVNANGLDNDTPLHDACVNNHYQIVRLLLRSGAKTNSTNCRGKTPFDVCRSPRILTLLEEAKSGSLTLDSTEKELSRIKLQDFDRSQFEREYTLSNNGTSPDLCQTLGMSRKTPPNNNKMDEKPVVPSSVPSSVSSNTGGGGSQSGNGTTLGGNARPVSPRVTLRLPHVPRTPEKSQQRSHETKNSSENEDVYEFRCTKEESKEGENEEKSEGGSVKPPEASSSDPKGDKRPRENDPESDDEVKKRRRKEESKEIAKTLGRGGGGGGVGQGRPSSSDKGMKLGQRTSSSNGNSSGKQSSSSSSTATTSTPSSTNTSSSVTSTITSTSTISCTGSSDHRKSPSTVSSPKPPSGNSKASPEKMDSDSDDTKNENNSGAPKVPPLKIVLAPCGLSEQETSSINGKNGSNRQLPYVVNSSSGSTEDKETTSIETKDVSPPIKEEPNIGSSSTSGTVSTLSVNTTNSSTTTLPVSTFGNTTITSLSSSNCSSTHMIASTTSATDKASATRITRSQRGGGSGSGSSSNYGDEPITIKTEPKTEDQMTTDVVHPRKRKIKMKEPEMEQILPAAVPEQPVATNCYEMFLKIRKQVERRRKLLFPVQPKPPQGFKDYLMNRCSYVLANNSNSQLSVPVIPAPASLSQALKDLFNEQEQERYKLRLQQLIEKEKLVLSVEQEILRVHGRAARALANQVLPFSVCTILKDEEVYNVISPEQEEKDRNARSRYNGRLFLSWLQDVDDKWEKIKEAMVLRHHNEAESLHAVQKMDWEWKLKENGLIEPNSKTQIDELHVPMVQVADFDLLPA